MTIQAKNLRKALKNVGIKSRIRTQVNSFGEYGDAFTVIESEKITDSILNYLVNDGCKVERLRLYTIVTR